ncbi:hypothetical protein OIU76_013003 [Salix suchowensis]|nr:hypothetical protein OIU76_013003 [Salix suchowensis]
MSARRSTSLRDSSAESERMEGTGSWDDPFDWFKLEVQHPASRSVSHHANYKCLLEAERVLVEGRGVVLINTDEAGTLIVTNFRLIFLSEGTENIIVLGTIPLATIEKFSKMAQNPFSTEVFHFTLGNEHNDWVCVALWGCKNQSAPHAILRRLHHSGFLQVIGKDMRIIVFGFRPKTKQRRAIYEGLCSAQNHQDSGIFMLLAGINGYDQQRVIYNVLNELWRISSVNSNYLMCPSYPFALIVPKSISDDEVIQASNFRSKGRLPVVSWCHPETGAVSCTFIPTLSWSDDDEYRGDEKLVAELCSQLGDEKKGRRKLYIADARPRKNALANVAMGGGSESSSNYFQSEVVFFGIELTYML